MKLKSSREEKKMVKITEVEARSRAARGGIS